MAGALYGQWGLFCGGWCDTAVPGQPCVTVPAENQRAGAADTTALGMSVLGPLHPQLPRALPCPPGTFPALEGGVSLGDSGLSPRWGPEPLWDLCCAQEVIPCHWQHFPSLRLYLTHLPPFASPEILHCVINPLAVSAWRCFALSVGAAGTQTIYCPL